MLAKWCRTCRYNTLRLVASDVVYLRALQVLPDLFRILGSIREDGVSMADSSTRKHHTDFGQVRDGCRLKPCSSSQERDQILSVVIQGCFSHLYPQRLRHIQAVCLMHTVRHGHCPRRRALHPCMSQAATCFKFRTPLIESDVQKWWHRLLHACCGAPSTSQQ